MNDMLLGAVAMAAFIAGAFFYRFWRRTGDRFYLYFALSFWIEGGSRVCIGLAKSVHEDGPFWYLFRLASYGLILLAIVDKNRPERSQQ